MKKNTFLFVLFFGLTIVACTPPESIDPNLVPPGNPQNVSTLAGSSGISGSANGTLSTASFNSPRGLTMDASGNIYVADYGNHLIRKIKTNGDVITFAGSGSAGFTNNTGVLASFNYPRDVAVDTYGNVFVVDCENHCIRKITPSGVVTTFAGSGNAGSTNGTGTAASFNYPSCIAIDNNNGTLYITDSGNHLIRTITASGVVTTLAGTGSAGNTNGNGILASFNNPFGIALSESGYVFVADRSNHLIRKISPTGEVTTLAGSGVMGSVDGLGTDASFNNPYGIAIDVNGYVFVTNWNTHTIRKINQAGSVSTLSGTGSIGFVNAVGVNASFNFPTGIFVSAGSLYISDSGNNAIRKISN